MSASLLIIATLILAANVGILLVLHRYLRRIDLHIKKRSELALLHLKATQVATLHLAFHGNPGVHSIVQELAAQSPDKNFQSQYSITPLMKTLDISRPVKADGGTVVCTVALGVEFRDAVAPCLDSQKAYAQRHGYAYAILEHTPPSADRPHSWLKLPLILRLLEEGAERVIYIDADAMITNADISAERFFTKFESQADLLLTEDEAGINCGVIFIANTSGARRILNLTWLYDADIYHGNWEQDALKNLVNDYRDVRRRIMIESRPKSFNSFPVERRRKHNTSDNNIWSAGDFICHFSGIRQPELGPLVRSYAKALSQA